MQKSILDLQERRTAMCSLRPFILQCSICFCLTLLLVGTGETQPFFRPVPDVILDLPSNIRSGGRPELDYDNDGGKFIQLSHNNGHGRFFDRDGFVDLIQGPAFHPSDSPVQFIPGRLRFPA